MLQAVIMAGGVGSRLRPLTCDLPKPMARLCGRPNIEYILELLKEHNVTDAAVTVQYLPQRISEHFDNVYCGINLTFVEETEPLGTAGSVKNASKYFAQADNEETKKQKFLKFSDKSESESACCIVISGDAMCDFDLTAAYKRHCKSGAAATISNTILQKISFQNCSAMGLKLQPTKIKGIGAISGILKVTGAASRIC